MFVLGVWLWLQYTVCAVRMHKQLHYTVLPTQACQNVSVNYVSNKCVEMVVSLFMLIHRLIISFSPQNNMKQIPAKHLIVCIMQTTDAILPTIAFQNTSVSFIGRPEAQIGMCLVIRKWMSTRKGLSESYIRTDMKVGREVKASGPVLFSSFFTC